MKTYHLSSNLTVILKYFVPLIWSVFFGALCIIFWVTDELMVGNMDLFLFRIGWSIFFLIGVILSLFTLMRLMRVEYDGTFAYVTNYFKIYKYPIENIESIKEKRFSMFRLAILTFKQPGYFGKKVIFLISRNRYDEAVTVFDNLKAVIK